MNGQLSRQAGRWGTVLTGVAFTLLHGVNIPHHANFKLPVRFAVAHHCIVFLLNRYEMDVGGTGS